MHLSIKEKSLSNNLINGYNKNKKGPIKEIPNKIKIYLNTFKTTTHSLFTIISPNTKIIIAY